MARETLNTEHGAYRVLVEVDHTNGISFKKVQGPYATKAAAKARIPWIERQMAWRVKNGGTVTTRLQEVKDPTWVDIEEEA